MTGADIKAALLHQFHGHAAFRRQNAKETHEENRTWDQKNTNHAISIECVISYIETLPDDAPAFSKLAACAALLDKDAGFRLPDDADVRIVHCGSKFRPFTDAEAATWFEDWADDVSKTTVEQIAKSRAAYDAELRKVASLDDRSER